MKRETPTPLSVRGAMQPKFKLWTKYNSKAIRFVGTVNSLLRNPMFDVYVADDRSFWCYFNGVSGMAVYTSFDPGTFFAWFWEQAGPMISVRDPSVSPHAT